MNRVHATCVAIDGRGVLIAGLRAAASRTWRCGLIDRGAQLVSDDYTMLDVAAGALVASAPATIAGRIEARGLGILPLAAAPATTVRVAGRGRRTGTAARTRRLDYGRHHHSHDSAVPS